MPVHVFVTMLDSLDPQERSITTYVSGFERRIIGPPDLIPTIADEMTVKPVQITGAPTARKGGGVDPVPLRTGKSYSMDSKGCELRN